MQASPHLPGKFVWFEHVSNDVSKMRAFYDPLFGWHTEAMPMGAQTYTMLQNGPRGIGGVRTAEAGMPNHWISYVSVPDVDAVYAQALKAGGRSLLAPTDFGDVGRAAGIADPTGAALCLWKSPQGDPSDVEKLADGDFIWNELWTTDAKKALAFYDQALGFTPESMPMGDGGTYHILKGPDGKQRAGLAQATTAGTPSAWLPYVKVADCDAKVEQARRLGARVMTQPTDIPGIGRFAVLVDPQGCGIAMLKPAM